MWEMKNSNNNIASSYIRRRIFVTYGKSRFYFSFFAATSSLTENSVGACVGTPVLKLLHPPLLPLDQCCLALKIPANSGLARLLRESSIVSALFRGGGEKAIFLLNMIDLPKLSVIHTKHLRRSSYLWQPLYLFIIV